MLSLFQIKLRSRSFKEQYNFNIKLKNNIVICVIRKANRNNNNNVIVMIVYLLLLLLYYYYYDYYCYTITIIRYIRCFVR